MSSLLQQTNLLNSLIEKAAASVSDGDRVSYSLSGSALFVAGEFTSSEVTLNVPADGDFYGHCFNIFLQGRVFVPGNSGQSDKTFRPTTITWESSSVLTGPGSLADFDTGLDFKFEIRDSKQGSYQTAPVYSTSLFSAQSNLILPKRPLISSWVGTLKFPVPFLIERGQSATVRLTPIDSRADSSAILTKREYRAVCVLQGYKSVHAFK